MAAVLVLLALAALVGVAIETLVVGRRDRRRVEELRALGGSGALDPSVERLRKALEAGGQPVQLDAALADSLASLGLEPRPARARAALLTALVVSIALLPLGRAMLGQAVRLAELETPVAGPAQYAAALNEVAQSLETLRAGGTATAFLLVVGVLLLGFRRWHLDPRTQRSLLRRALVEGVLRKRPEAPLPETAAMLRALEPPIRTAELVGPPLLFATAAVLGLGLLAALGTIRAANEDLLSMPRWPDPHRVSADMALVAGAAGRALPSGTSLMIGASQLLLGAEPLASLEDGKLPDGWPGVRSGPSVTEGQVLLAAEESLALATLLPVLRSIYATRSARTFWLVLERRLGGEDRAQAGLEVVLEPGPEGTPRLSVQPDAIVLGGERFGPPGRADQHELRRALLGALGPRARDLNIKVPATWSYGQLTQQLVALDAACAPGLECGLPGLGLRFHLSVE